MTNHELSVLFFFQLAFILAAVRLVGLLARRLGQPQVVGEMVAGVLIGPSLLGALFPGLQARLFPADSITILYAVSQIGIVLYMFLVGAEFDLDMVRQRAKIAISVSTAGIITPFILGSLLTLLLVRHDGLFAPQVKTWEAMLFVSAAMSITAFPMLARIIYERGLTGTRLGNLALAAGSIDDAAAWCILAVVLASFGGNALIAVMAIAGGAFYGLVILFLARPLLRLLEVPAEKNNTLSRQAFGFILLLLMLGAWYTDFVGIYAVFGAFVLGVAMPRGIVTRDLRRRLEPVATSFLVPLFFVYSGLNTHLGLLIAPDLLGITILVILVACVGKAVACWAAARLNGEDNREAMALGTLMNARGMMELILLNIGLERGIITTPMFTVMVIMAIVTTLMASPAFELVYRRIPQARLARLPGPV